MTVKKMIIDNADKIFNNRAQHEDERTSIMWYRSNQNRLVVLSC